MPVEQTMIESKVLLREQDDVPSEERNRRRVENLWRAKMDYQFLCQYYKILKGVVVFVVIVIGVYRKYIR